MPKDLENSAVATGLKKINFHSNPKEGQCQRMFTPPYNYTDFTCQQGNAQNSPSQDSTVLEPRLPDVQDGFRESKGTRDQVANINWIINKKQENLRKKITSASLTMGKPFTVWITTNSGTLLKRWE